jgi:hypothetical protein
MASWLQADVAKPIIDPTTGQQFPGNKIPSTRLAPFLQTIHRGGFIATPTPGRENLALNYYGISPTIQNDHKWVWRGDLVVGEKQDLRARDVV